MVINATVENNVIKLPPGVHLPNGTEVSIQPKVQPPTASLELRREMTEKFLSGEWSAELAGFEEGRQQDRADAEASARRWRE